MNSLASSVSKPYQVQKDSQVQLLNELKKAPRKSTLSRKAKRKRNKKNLLIVPDKINEGINESNDEEDPSSATQIPDLEKALDI